MYMKIAFVIFFVILTAGLLFGTSLTLYSRSLPFGLNAAFLCLSLAPPQLPPLPSPVLLAAPPPPRLPSESFLHNMDDDDELFLRALQVPRREALPNGHVPKVAFMFLTKGRLPLRPLWELFFKGHEGHYSIYVHTHPSYNESVPETSVFHGRRIPSKAVQWGNSSMIDAERRLLASALLDSSNERFVLLSESCIPLFNFSTIYTYLLHTNQSFVGSFDDPRKVGRGRYNRQMYPQISISDWRKGSQWFEVTRVLAIAIVSDKTYYPLFQRFCSRPCYTDEHYIPTLVNIVSPETNSNRSTTWVDWSKPGPHPGRFAKRDISAEFLNRIRFGRNCSYDGHSSSICFLFARKFVGDTLPPLLKIAPALLGFNS